MGEVWVVGKLHMNMSYKTNFCSFLLQKIKIMMTVLSK